MLTYLYILIPPIISSGEKITSLVLFFLFMQNEKHTANKITSPESPNESYNQTLQLTDSINRDYQSRNSY